MLFIASNGFTAKSALRSLHPSTVASGLSFLVLLLVAVPLMLAERRGYEAPQALNNLVIGHGFFTLFLMAVSRELRRQHSYSTLKFNVRRISRSTRRDVDEIVERRQASLSKRELWMVYYRYEAISSDSPETAKLRAEIQISQILNKRSYDISI
jgi:hypothetical protein